MNRNSPLPAPRGYTLVELIIGVVAASFVVAGAVSLLIGQQRRFQTSAADRGLQETARTALAEITGNLRLAGYGVDPPLAFDFGPAASLRMSQAPLITGATVATPGYRCDAGAVRCRDRIDGPDELVFYSRDPYFGHQATAVSESSLTIAGPLNVPLYKGQILLVMAEPSAATGLWAYVTVNDVVPAAPAAATVTIPLAAAAGDPLDFPTQNQALANASFSKPGAMVAKIDRYRYFIRNVDAAGNEQPFLTDFTTPFLMLDQGLSDADGERLTPIAPDVEDLQLAYQFPNAATPALQLVGGADPNLLAVGQTGGGAAISADSNGIDLAPASGSPGYGMRISIPPTATQANQHPGNIRAVQVAIVVRQATPDITVQDAVVPGSLNRPDIAGRPGYRRLRMQTTVPVPNMDARSPLFITYSQNAGADGINVGGG